MRVIEVRVDGQMMLLSPSTDVDALKTTIVAGVREGGSFVDFETVGHGVVSVLITPLLPVRFEILERSEEQVVEWEENPPAIDGFVDAEVYLSSLDG